MDLPKIEELKKLVKFCRTSGIKSLKFGEFQIELDSGALFPESNYKKQKQEQGSDQDQRPLVVTDDMLIDWSSGGIPGTEELNG